MAALLSTADTAERLGVSIRTITRRVAAGHLVPAAKAPGLRGAYLFDPDEIEALAESATAGG